MSPSPKNTLFTPLGALVLLAAGPACVQGRTITVKNSCDQSVWPAKANSQSDFTLPSSFTTELKSGASSVLDNIPDDWNGRIWGRTVCGTFGTGKVACVTGDCNDGELICSASGQPSTVAEINMSAGGDSYDVSLVDGFNIPINLTPSDSSCKVGECSGNVNAVCPPALVHAISGGKNYACQAACKQGIAQGTYNNAAGSPSQGNRNCCNGIYDTPGVCGKNQIDYVDAFKETCKGAYSYAYDDATSLWTCGGEPTYTIEFCPGTDKTFSGPSEGSQQYAQATASNASFVPSGYTFVSFAESNPPTTVDFVPDGVGSGSTAGSTASSTSSSVVVADVQGVKAVGAAAGGSQATNTTQVNQVTVTDVSWTTVTSTTSNLAKRDDTPTPVASTESYTTITGATITSGTMFTVESLVLRMPPTNSGVYLRPTFVAAAKREEHIRRSGGKSHGRRWF